MVCCTTGSPSACADKKVLISLAATGNGGGSVLASAELLAHVVGVPAPSMHPPCAATHYLLTNRSLLDDFFQLRKDLIILGIYLRRFQNPRGDSVSVSILHHRPSGAGG